MCVFIARYTVGVPAGRSVIFEGGSKFLHEDRLLGPGGDGRTPIRNVGDHLLVNMAQHHGRMRCSTLLM